MREKVEETVRRYGPGRAEKERTRGKRKKKQGWAHALALAAAKRGLNRRDMASECE